MCFTFKDLQGPSGHINPVNREVPRGITAQQRGLFSLKSDTEIVGNVADLLCYTKNEVKYNLMLFPLIVITILS